MGLGCSLGLLLMLTTGCGEKAVMPWDGITGKHLEDKNAALRAENEQLRNELNNTHTQLSTIDADRASLVEQIANANQPAAEPAPPADKPKTGFGGIDGVDVEQLPGRVTVRVPGDVLFSSGKTTLRSSAQRTLARIAQVINSQYAGKTVRVEGYTDTDPIRKSKWKDNLELSLQRAMAVQRYLQSQGVSGKRLYSSGFSKFHPRGSKSTSRRVEIVVLD